MSQVIYRANLSAAVFPMTVSEGGRTVIVPGPDNVYDRRLDPEGEQSNAGIPQALYLENVLPTLVGYQSVGYIDSGFTLPMPVGAHLVRKFDIKAPGVTFTGLHELPLFIYSDLSLRSGKFGQATVVFSGAPADFRAGISSAVVRGVCYLYSRLSRQLYTTVFDEGLNQLTLTNITATVTPVNFFSINDIQNICGSANYLICDSVLQIYWSSTTSPIDFVPSLVTGAGSQTPNDTNSFIKYLRATQNGFYIYTNTNILYAQYTGNARYPWRFIPVLNSNTVLDVYTQIAGEPTNSAQYLMEIENQLKVLVGKDIQPIAPEIVDYLTRTSSHQQFNYITNIFTTTPVKSVFPRLNVYLNRYVLISVNGSGKTDPLTNYNPSFSHVIVYDLVLRRYGKLAVTHSEIYIVRDLSDHFKENLVFLDPITRRFKILHFDIYETTPLPSGGDFGAAVPTYIPQTGVFLLGRLQYVRSRFLKLFEIEVEGPQNLTLQSNQNFSCVVFPSLDGHKFDAAKFPYRSYSSEGLHKYLCLLTAKNFSIMLKGAFSLSTLQCTFSAAGKY